MTEYAICPQHHAHKIALDASGFQTYGLFVGVLGACKFDSFRLDYIKPLAILKREAASPAAKVMTSELNS